METRIQGDCNIHGLQTVQSILMPQGYYYLECGCIYHHKPKYNRFELLRPYGMSCSECNKEILDELIIGESTLCSKCREKDTRYNREHTIIELPQNNALTVWVNNNDQQKVEGDLKKLKEM